MTGTELTKQPIENSILEVIARAASDPNVDVAKMSALLEMQEKIMVHQREIAFNEAMAAMEPKLPRIQKTKKVAFKDVKYSYAPNEEIDIVIRPLLREHGFSLYFDAQPATGGLVWSGHLKHKDGHTRTASILLPSDTSGGKNSVQAMGSASSYARRYTTCMLLNLITSDMADDDGIKSGAITQEQASQLETLILKSGSDRKRFLAYMKAEDVPNIQQEDYTRAVMKLTEKLNKS